MDYTKHYYRLIGRAKNRKLTGYKEQHHITPRCLGGSNVAENLVYLTAREHFIAHLLLVKMYPDNHKLVYAAIMMTVFDSRHKRSRNRRYEWLKQRHSNTVSQNQTGRKNSQYGTKWISNLETKVNKKINKNLPIPDGWNAGRNIWLQVEKEDKKEVKRQYQQYVKQQRLEISFLRQELKEIDERLRKKGAQIHYHNFIQSDYKSLREYANGMQKQAMTLSNWFKTYIPEYNITSRPRTRLKTIQTDTNKS